MGLAQPRTYKNVDSETSAFSTAVQNINSISKWSTDPIDMYKDSTLNIQQAKHLALEVLSVPTGEAQSSSIGLEHLPGIRGQVLG